MPLAASSTVDKEQVEQALRLLNEFDEEYLDRLSAPNCGGNNIIQVSKQSPANIITAVLTRLFPAMRCYRTSFTNARIAVMKLKNTEQ